jgi:hypothetical protein
LQDGGAEGIRTLDLLDAIEARSQLRHGPTGGEPQFYSNRRANRQKIREHQFLGSLFGNAKDVAAVDLCAV